MKKVLYLSGLMLAFAVISAMEQLPAIELKEMLNTESTGMKQPSEIELEEPLSEKYTDSPDLQQRHDTLMALCLELSKENEQLRSLNEGLQSKIQALQQAPSGKKFARRPSLTIAEAIGTGEQY